MKRKDDAQRFEIISKQQMKLEVGHSPDFIEALFMVMHLFGKKTSASGKDLKIGSTRRYGDYKHFQHDTAVHHGQGCVHEGSLPSETLTSIGDAKGGRLGYRLPTL